MPPEDELLECICQENNQYGVNPLPGYSERVRRSRVCRSAKPGN
jgi:hypothetical protein